MQIDKKVFVEFIATYILVFAGCGAIVIEALTGSLTHLGVALTFGLVITALIYTFGHISGAHMNPAVTISFSFIGEFDQKLVLKYVPAQCLGAIFAAATLYLLFITEVKQLHELSYLGTTLPRSSTMQTFILEFILTFILMLVICGSAIHGKAIKSFAGIAIGATVGLEALFAGPISGASMNPARSLGPALVSLNLEALWVYIVATTAGALAAATVFKNFIKCKDPKECSV